MISEEGTFTPDKIFLERRYGRIDIAKPFYESDTETVQKLFALIIPMRVEFDYEMQIFKIVAMSEHFESTEQGQQIPYYQVTINKTSPITDIKFKRV